MIYVYEDPYHVIHLSEEETNGFFDPFDPTDEQMPSHLHHRGHRYIMEWIYDWLLANVGPAHIAAGGAWEARFGGMQRRHLVFVDKSNAMKFKLAFHNRV